MVVEDGVEVPIENTIAVSLLKPSCDAVGVVLVARAAVSRKGVFPECGIHLGDDRPAGIDLPAVERPEVD